MADRLLSFFNPQDGEEPTEFPHALPKRHRKLPITYSKAVSGSDALGSTPGAQTFPSVSTIMDHDLDSLYQRLLPRLSAPRLLTLLQSQQRNWNATMPNVN
jgi:hypothetical protein